MKTSSCLGGQIQADYWLILAIRAVFEHFYERGNRDILRAFQGEVSLKKEVDSEPDEEWGDAVV